MSTMESRELGSQLRVGIFLVLGLAAVAAMVVYFGRFGDGIRSYYQLRVEYPNASGLLKGASVLLAGAKVGSVETPPTILPDMEGVYVMLKIYEEVHIPSASEFSVGSSGLLGDRFVQITLGKGALESPPIEPGSVIKGKSESGGFAELTEGAGDLMGDIREAVNSINTIAQKLDSQLLSEASISDLKKTMKNLEQTSASFAEASGKVDSVLEQAKQTVSAGDSTLASTKAAAEEFRKAMVDVRALVAQVKQGRGPLGALLNDREMADNLRALVVNMRRHGILWYRDAAKGGPPASR